MATKTTKVFLSVFILAILGVVLLQAIGDSVVGVTSTIAYNDTSAGTTFTAANGAVTDLQGKEVSNFLAINQTGSTVAATNYTLLADQRSASSGTITAQINISDTGATVYGTTWNLSYDYEPVGYVSGSSGRSVTTLIMVVLALALLIMVVAGFINTDRARKLLGIGRFR